MLSEFSSGYAAYFNDLATINPIGSIAAIIGFACAGSLIAELNNKSSIKGAVLGIAATFIIGAILTGAGISNPTMHHLYPVYEYGKTAAALTIGLPCAFLGLKPR